MDLDQASPESLTDNTNLASGKASRNYIVHSIKSASALYSRGLLTSGTIQLRSVSSARRRSVALLTEVIGRCVESTLDSKVNLMPDIGASTHLKPGHHLLEVDLLTPVSAQEVVRQLGLRKHCASLHFNNCMNC